MTDTYTTLAKKYLVPRNTIKSLGFAAMYSANGAGFGGLEAMVRVGLPRTNRIVGALHDMGHVVTEDERTPGLYRVDGGPELTAGQLESYWRSL
jgi:hypothetical protein